jgi:hypothetical protein
MLSWEVVCRLPVAPRLTVGVRSAARIWCWAPHHHEEHRHEEHGQHGGRDHAAHHAGADGALAGRARARRHHQGQHAQDEGQRGHDDRTETQVTGPQRGLDQAHALLMQLLGELDDQDGVLGRQPDDGDQAHLEVDVVGQVAQVGAQQRAQDAQGHHQQHGHRDGPAFVQRGQTQEHGQQREHQQDGGLRARQTLFARQARPLDAHTRRQLLGQTLQLGHGVARAVAR